MSKEEELEKKKAAFIRMLEDELPYDHERFLERMKEGCKRQSARLQADGIIEFSVAEWWPDGSHSYGYSAACPGDSNYEELRTTHSLKNPGDTSTVLWKMVDGKWVVRENEFELREIVSNRVVDRT